MKTLSRIRVVAAMPIIVACAALAACSAGPAEPAESTLERVERTGILTVALANEPPAAIVNSDGTLTGVEIEVLRSVVDDLGIEELQGAITPFQSMIPGLLAQRWDVIAAGLNMKQSRCEQALFSEPIIVSTESFAVKTGNPSGLTSIQDAIDNPSIMIGILPGTFEESVLANAGLPTSQITMLQDIRGGLEAVAAGRIDAYMSPTLGLKTIAETTSGVEVTLALPDSPITGSGVVFRMEDEDFRDIFNEKLAEFKETSAYADILTEWGYNAADVEGVTSEELCQIPG